MTKVIPFAFVVLFLPVIAFSQGNPNQEAIRKLYSGNNLLRIAGDQYQKWPPHASVLSKIGFHPVDTIGVAFREIYWSDSPEGSLIFKVGDNAFIDDELRSIIITDKSQMELPFGFTWEMDRAAVLKAVSTLNGAFNIVSSKTGSPEVEFRFQNGAMLSSVVKVHWEEDEGFVHKGRYLEISPQK